ncbi:site-specific integrase [Paraburkholderia strydomiana]|uniref:site-specific integrase n=1 Tax=Paraburkholderia strydomiana TaxID=1245417 RepID=UPI0038B8038A
MNKRRAIPDLTIPDTEFGEGETPWSLNIFLYKGGAAARADEVQSLIEGGALGDWLPERLALVARLHDEISAARTGGGSRETVRSNIVFLRHFFSFVDLSDLPLKLDSVTETYCEWADSLVQRTRIKAIPGKKHQRHKTPLKMNSAYQMGACVGALLDRALERTGRMLDLTQLESPKRRPSAIGKQSEKQNLEHTFAFGHLVQDICDELTAKTVLEAPFPVTLRLRSGATVILFQFTGTVSSDDQHGISAERYPLINSRVEAELMMFIGQTGMNLAQAHKAKLAQFSYSSYLDGYQVRDYKRRRNGEVLFEIYKAYKPHFERYLAWRRRLFPDSTMLFPLVGARARRPAARAAGQSKLREACRKANVVFVPPQTLRNTRVNWLLRMTGDPDLTAEMDQHIKQTLLQDYAKPSLQLAMVEVTKFWKKHDPHVMSVAPGNCSGLPKAVDGKPDNAPKADCTRPSGCLWCENHRDIDSFDYVWAMTSFSYLKNIELGRVRSPAREESTPPSQLAVERIYEKLRWFENSNTTRREWVEESSIRMAEGHFHPNFNFEISELEGTSEKK